MLPDDINLRAKALRKSQAEQEAEQRQLTARAAEQRAAETRRQQRHAEHIEVLCDQFYEWAVTHHITKSSSRHWRLTGWRLASHRWHSGDGYNSTGGVTELWVTPKNGIRILSINDSGFKFDKKLSEPNINWLQGFSLGEVRTTIAEYVASSGQKWDG